MDEKESKNLLVQSCNKYGLDCDAVIQFKCARNKPVGKRYQCKASYTNRLESHLYAIKYFPAENLFLAWNLWEGARLGDNFSVATDKIAVIPEHIFITVEYTDHKGRDMRSVYAFGPECLEEFVRRYIARVSNKNL